MIVVCKIVYFSIRSFFIVVEVAVGLTGPVIGGLIDDNLSGFELGRIVSGISFSSSGSFFSFEYGSSISSSGSISGTSGANGTSGSCPMTSSDDSLGHGTYEQGASIRFRPAQNSFSITSIPKNGCFQTFFQDFRIFQDLPLRHVLYR